MKKIAQIFKWHNSESFYVNPTGNGRNLYRFDGSLVQLLIMLNDFEQSDETSFFIYQEKFNRFIKSAFSLEDTKNSKLFQLVADYTNGELQGV